MGRLPLRRRQRIPVCHPHVPIYNVWPSPTCRRTGTGPPGDTSAHTFSTGSAVRTQSNTNSPTLSPLDQRPGRTDEPHRQGWDNQGVPLSLKSLKTRVLAFVSAYNFVKHLNALRWKAPFEAICQTWTIFPRRISNSAHFTSSRDQTPACRPPALPMMASRQQAARRARRHQIPSNLGLAIYPLRHDNGQLGPALLLLALMQGDHPDAAQVIHFISFNRRRAGECEGSMARPL